MFRPRRQLARALKLTRSAEKPRPDPAQNTTSKESRGHPLLRLADQIVENAANKRRGDGNLGEEGNRMAASIPGSAQGETIKSLRFDDSAAFPDCSTLDWQGETIKSLRFDDSAAVPDASALLAAASASSATGGHNESDDPSTLDASALLAAASISSTTGWDNGLLAIASVSGSPGNDNKLLPAAATATGPAGWDDELLPADFTTLDQTLRQLQPRYKPAAELVPDLDMLVAVRLHMTARHAAARPAEAALCTSKHFNSQLFFGENTRPWDREAPLKVPRIVVVTGHAGAGGNAGLNGIYERYPDDFKGRPVYQKKLEKRAADRRTAASCLRSTGRMTRSRSTPSASSTGAGSVTKRSWSPSSPRARIKLDAAERWEIFPAPAPTCGPMEIRPPVDGWFLFFDRGCWRIGPAVGSREVYARCPAAEQLAPSTLADWEVWDVGRRCFYRHKRLRALKGGF